MKKLLLSLILAMSTFFISAQTDSQVEEIVVEETQELVIEKTITDISTEINTAKITISVSGGEKPYSYTWSEKSKSNSLTDEEVSILDGATEGNEYSVTVTDSKGAEKTLTFVVPAVSVPEVLSASFAPVVGFMDTYFFFDQLKVLTETFELNFDGQGLEKAFEESGGQGNQNQGGGTQ